MTPIPLPPTQLRFMREDDAKFEAIGSAMANRLAKIGRTRTILDIGCGYGRLAYALRQLGQTEKYLGIDILKRHIDWLKANFTDDRFSFEHLDIQNQRYNKEGKLQPSEVRFSFGFQPDAVVLTSVFTHMDENDIQSYLNQIASILSAESVVYCTFFVFDKPGKRSFPFAFKRSDHCYYEQEEDPLFAIAYSRKFIDSMVDRAGLKVKDFEYGFQDTFYLVRK